MKRIKVLFITIICASLLLSIIYFNREHNFASPIDNRMLTEWDTSGSIDEDVNMIDSFINDRIGFRSSAITQYAKLNDAVFGMMMHPSYTYGQDGYVFFKPAYENVNEDFIDIFCSFIKEVQDYCEERGVPFIYCLNPSKMTVYSQYLPKGYIYRDLFNQAMCVKLEEKGINYISNEECLKEKSKTEQVYNVKYDAGHWNDLGCFYGTNNILRKVSEYFDTVKENNIEYFELEMRTMTSLPVSYFEINEDVPVLLDKKEDKITDITEDYEAVHVDKNHSNKKMLVNTASGAEDLPRVLMFKGSYYNGREKFFESAFKEYDAIHNYENFIDFDYYFNIFQPDCVILETAEYATGGKYFSVEKMNSKRFNSVLDTDAAELEDISEYSYSIETNGSVVTINVEPKDSFTEGYLVIGDRQFDLITDETGNCYCDIDSRFCNDNKDIKILFR